MHYGLKSALQLRDVGKQLQDNQWELKIVKELEDKLRKQREDLEKLVAEQQKTVIECQSEI